MSVKEKLLIIGAIDSLLIDELDFTDHFTSDERELISNKFEEIFDTTSPRDIRESLTLLGRKFYEEIKDELEQAK